MPRANRFSLPRAIWHITRRCHDRKFLQQIQNNLVALISIFIAVSSLGYNTWRNEKSEEQRNIRHAAFRVLESLGDLQEVVNSRYRCGPDA